MHILLAAMATLSQDVGVFGVNNGNPVGVAGYAVYYVPASDPRAPPQPIGDSHPHAQPGPVFVINPPNYSSTWSDASFAGPVYAMEHAYARTSLNGIVGGARPPTSADLTVDHTSQTGATQWMMSYCVAGWASNPPTAPGASAWAVVDFQNTFTSSKVVRITNYITGNISVVPGMYSGFDYCMAAGFAAVPGLASLGATVWGRHQPAFGDITAWSDINGIFRVFDCHVYAGPNFWPCVGWMSQLAGAPYGPRAGLIDPRQDFTVPAGSLFVMPVQLGLVCTSSACQFDPFAHVSDGELKTTVQVERKNP